MPYTRVWEVKDEEGLQEAFRIRKAVFVDEQRIEPGLDQDGLDRERNTTHILIEDDGAIAGTARMIAQGDIVRIGRLAVLKDHRGRGLGRKLMEFMIERCRGRPIRAISLGAQAHSIGFYEKLGFKAMGPVFLEAGIEHQRMELALR